MLMRKAFKKIIISISCFIILGIVYIFPNNNSEINNNVVKSNNEANIIYLLDKNNYISRVTTVLSTNTLESQIREIISYLTIDSNKYIRDGFKKTIPKNTKIIDISIHDSLVKINFSKELINVDEKNEQRLIESIVYSLTSLDKIKYVSIFVEGKILDRLPNSKQKLNTILDRSIGINKEFNINNIYNTTKTTVYYLSKYKDYYYYVPITKIYNNNISKIELIIKELSSNKLLNTNLISYLNNKTELLSYNETDKSLILNFNENIFNSINSSNILEEVTYSINLSIKDNYENVEEVLYYVNDKIINSFYL